MDMANEYKWVWSDRPLPLYYFVRTYIVHNIQNTCTYVRTSRSHECEFIHVTTCSFAIIIDELDGKHIVEQAVYTGLVYLQLAAGSNAVPSLKDPCQTYWRIEVNKLSLDLVLLVL